MPGFIFVEFFCVFYSIEILSSLDSQAHSNFIFTFILFVSILIFFYVFFSRSNQSIKKMKEVPYSMHVGGKNPIVYRAMWLLKNEKKIEILMVLVLPAIVAPIFR